ncbi:MAG TPA: hypothetical protein VF634_13270 [Pyrinomonadaceae bacterium]
MLAAALLLLVATSGAQETGWRGIVPLHSTRADVERLIGKPEMPGGFYDSEAERASVFYQRHTCEESKGEGYNVPKDTVLFIRVNFKNRERAMSEFPVNWSQYVKTEGGHVRGYAYYSNRDKGISYETYEGRVVAVEYGGTTADAHLLCPESLKPPKLFAAAELTSASRELLDKFVLRLKRDKGAWGLISLNQEYKKPEEIERMRRSVEDYLSSRHSAVRARLSVSLSFQAEDMELFILIEGQEQPIRFRDK